MGLPLPLALFFSGLALHHLLLLQLSLSEGGTLAEVRHLLSLELFLVFDSDFLNQLLLFSLLGLSCFEAEGLFLLLLEDLLLGCSHQVFGHLAVLTLKTVG